MGSFLSKRRQDNIAASERRKRTVKVRMNDSEIAALDSVRGRISRAETIRFLLHEKMPAPIPEVNREAWLSLSKSASNLNQIARGLNQSDKIEVQQIMAELSAFRDALIGAKS